MRWLVILCCCISACSGLNQPSSFTSKGLSGWQPQSFGKLTDYSVVDEGGRRAIKAHSLQSASALYQRLEVNLTHSPYLNWAWKVENTLGELDEQSKRGDDYPARVYVLLQPLTMRFTPRALCYVWASNTPEGGHWSSPYSDNVVIVNLRSGEKHAGQWLSEKRNVREDIRRFLGEEINHVEGLAIMSDTDNSLSEATSYFGDLYFTAD